MLFTAGISSNVKNNILVKLSYFLSRRYGNVGNRPAHALSIDDIKKVVQLMKTMQRHTVLLPGHIPGVKDFESETPSILYYKKECVLTVLQFHIVKNDLKIATRNVKITCSHNCCFNNHLSF